MTPLYILNINYFESLPCSCCIMYIITLKLTINHGFMVTLVASYEVMNLNFDFSNFIVICCFAFFSPQVKLKLLCLLYLSLTLHSILFKISILGHRVCS